jgi:hypothetical protein
MDNCHFRYITWYKHVVYICSMNTHCPIFIVNWWGEGSALNIKLYVLFSDNVPLNIMNHWNCSKIISNTKNTMAYNHYFWCNYNQMNQWWQRTQPQMGLFLTFWFFQRKEFLKDFFCNFFLKRWKFPQWITLLVLTIFE